MLTSFVWKAIQESMQYTSEQKTILLIEIHIHNGVVFSINYSYCPLAILYARASVLSECCQCVYVMVCYGYNTLEYAAERQISHVN